MQKKTAKALKFLACFRIRSEFAEISAPKVMEPGNFHTIFISVG